MKLIPIVMIGIISLFALTGCERVVVVHDQRQQGNRYQRDVEARNDSPQYQRLRYRLIPYTGEHYDSSVHTRRQPFFARQIGQGTSSGTSQRYSYGRPTFYRPMPMRRPMMRYTRPMPQGMMRYGRPIMRYHPQYARRPMQHRQGPQIDPRMIQQGVHFLGTFMRHR